MHTKIEKKTQKFSIINCLDCLKLVQNLNFRPNLVCVTTQFKLINSH